LPWPWGSWRHKAEQVYPRVDGPLEEWIEDRRAALQKALVLSGKGQGVAVRIRSRSPWADGRS
jgi:hypothetical protein